MQVQSREGLPYMQPAAVSVVTEVELSSQCQLPLLLVWNLLAQFWSQTTQQLKIFTMYMVTHLPFAFNGSWQLVHLPPLGLNLENLWAESELLVYGTPFYLLFPFHLCHFFPQLFPWTWPRPSLLHLLTIACLKLASGLSPISSSVLPATDSIFLSSAFPFKFWIFPEVWVLLLVPLPTISLLCLHPNCGPTVTFYY